MQRPRKTHRLPEGVGPRLDLRVPPEGAWRASHYHELVDLLEELGRMLDAGLATPGRLRDWENAVAPLLHGDELGQLMAPRPGEDDFPDRASLPAQRWENLRDILAARKGLGPP